MKFLAVTVFRNCRAVKSGSETSLILPGIKRTWEISKCRLIYISCRKCYWVDFNIIFLCCFSEILETKTTGICDAWHAVKLKIDTILQGNTLKSVSMSHPENLNEDVRWLNDSLRNICKRFVKFSIFYSILIKYYEHFYEPHKLSCNLIIWNVYSGVWCYKCVSLPQMIQGIISLNVKVDVTR